MEMIRVFYLAYRKLYGSVLDSDVFQGQAMSDASQGIFVG
jgi:hypothetical protein